MRPPQIQTIFMSSRIASFKHGFRQRLVVLCVCLGFNFWKVVCLPKHLILCLSRLPVYGSAEDEDSNRLRAMLDAPGSSFLPPVLCECWGEVVHLNVTLISANLAVHLGGLRQANGNVGGMVSDLR